MSYRIKEIYFTQQGEGRNTGMDAVFVRFSGCNLWSGKEKHRAKAICSFCDTDFNGIDGVNGGEYTKELLLSKIESLWLSENKKINVVLTGGEPLLQADQTLVDHLKSSNIYIAIETNGTIKAPSGIDWVCVSPKPNTKILQDHGHELKFIYPQDSLHPDEFESLAFDNLFIQPMDSVNYYENLNLALKYCMAKPKWQLSLQTHKILGIR